MDDYIPIHICDDIIPEDISNEDMMQRIFRRQSIEQNIPINELALNPTYQVYRR